jgi:EmrB/QacA subfamily drug resistance transporter
MNSPEVGAAPVAQATSSAETAAAVETEGHPRRWWILAVVLAAEILDLLDSTIVTVAGPSIRADLGGTASMIQWISAAYTLAFGVLLVIGGRMGDRFGRRSMFVIGAASFTAMSVACAAATTPGLLIGFRVLQGAFGAMLLPQGLGILTSVFPKDQIGKAFSLFGPVIGLSAVLGPILAGSLIDLDAWGTGWRLLFLINLPLGIAAVVGALRWVPVDRANPGVVIDLLSGLILAIALFLIIYALIQGPDQSWPTWSYACLAAGFVAGIGFVVRERQAPHPLIHPSLLANRSFTSGLILLLVFFAGLSGLMLTISLYVQGVLHWSPFRAGLTMTPMAIGMVVGAIGAMPFVARLGRRLILAGLFVNSVGALGIAWCVHHYGVQVHLYALAIPILVVGIGMGFVTAPLFDVILAGVSEETSGSASGTLTALQQVAGAIGVAGVTTIYLSLLHRHSAPDSMAIGSVAVAGLLFIGCLLVFALPRKAAEDHGVGGEAAG